MPLKINPPRPPSPSLSPSQLHSHQQQQQEQQQQTHRSGPLTLADLPPPPSPTYSPITPKVQPALPATYSPHGAHPSGNPPPANTQPPQQLVDGTIAPSLDRSSARQQYSNFQQQLPFGQNRPPPQMQQHQPPLLDGASTTTPSNHAPNGTSHQQPQQSPIPSEQRSQPPPVPPQLPPAQSSIRPTEYVPSPPSLPFSGSDATDSIALRAAISSLQFQKQKAQRDLQQLEKIKNLALGDPEHFRTELAAGKLKEQQDRTGSLQNILDRIEDGDSDDEVDFSALTAGHGGREGGDDAGKPEEVPDSQNSTQQPLSAATSRPSSRDAEGLSHKFPAIPGPQNVVRMPHVNWDKYHVLGEPLDRMHEQQRKWPGNAALVSSDRGREYAVASPYSPFFDREDGVAGAVQQQDGRKDTRRVSEQGGSLSAAGSPLTTVSEHPMATRRGSSRPHQW